MKKSLYLSHIVLITLLCVSLAIFLIIGFAISDRIPTNNTTHTVMQPTQKPVSTKMNTVVIYLVALGDAGKSGEEIACGDSLVKINKQTTDYPTVKTAIKELLSIKTVRYGESGLYNALSLSTLSLQSIETVNNVDIVHLTGSYFLGGECDGPRFIQQIRATAAQYSQGRPVLVQINGVSVAQLFSGKGETEQ
jgi:hypothetical protein